MKAVFSLIALAATALAQDILPRGDRGDTPKSVTQTVITTTTVCPITSTYTEVRIFSSAPSMNLFHWAASGAIHLQTPH